MRDLIDRRCSAADAWVRHAAWLLECRSNRTLIRRAAERASLPRIVQKTPELPRTAGCFDLALVITTFARPDACLRLVRALRHSLEHAGRLDSSVLLVFNDASGRDYGQVEAELQRSFAHRHAFFQAEHRIGKRRFWYVHERALEELREVGPAHAFYLQDDMEIETPFIQHALERWQDIDDDRKAVLYLCTMPDDEPAGRWIHFRRRPSADGATRLTQWFDLSAFLVGPRFFEVVGTRVIAPPPTHWRMNPARSSGVGEQFTRRLFRRAHIHQLTRTLAFHGSEASTMNPDARETRVMDNRSRASRDHGPG